tara:strand:+ start:500 stop:1585 length:1086 start_codon:yes stop_codon:yes gene_type:complete
MATTFKDFQSNDITNTRTLLHEAIPITGSIPSGTYADNNIKEYAHGMFQSTYDYPYLSSSANQIFDITFGYSAESALSASTNTMHTKKANIYNQMAQYLVGYSASGSLKRFKDSGGNQFNDLIFINFARLLSKDEIKKGSFSLQFITGSPLSNPGQLEIYTLGPNTYDGVLSITDTSGANGYRVDSPVGEYGYLYHSGNVGGEFDSGLADPEIGLIYYQAGIVAISGGVAFSTSSFGAPDTHSEENPEGLSDLATGSNINAIADGVRNRIHNISFNNTTELNSTIYFCRVSHNDFNYSSNPTYTTGSKIRTKTISSDAPVSYCTSVGLYSANNELLAVAKLSEPLKKDPTTEFTLRVRLDY